MYGVVVFYYRRRDTLPVNISTTITTTGGSDGGAGGVRGGGGWGEILYKVAGQKCDRCSPAKYEMPLWYAEEAQKVSCLTLSLGDTDITTTNVQCLIGLCRIVILPDTGYSTIKDK